MYGTVFHFRPKQGQEQAVVELFERWWRDRAPKIKGAQGGYVFKTDKDPREWIGVAVFDNKENYVANANDPEQDRWYREILALLESEPTWTDGEVLHARP